MIIFDKNSKNLEIPVGLGNLEVTVVSGGSGTAGVISINGQTGALNIKTINGNDVLGRGNIEIDVDPEPIIESAVTEAKAYTDEAIEEAIFSGATENYYTSAQTDNAIQTAIDGQKFKTINGNSILGEGNIEIQGGGGATTGEVQTMIDAAISAETARTENVYLKQEVLANYYTSGQTDQVVQDAIHSIDLSDYYTMQQTDNAIGAAIASETARTESTYLKEHQSLANYYTSAQTQEYVSEAIFDLPTRTEVEQSISSALTNYSTTAQTQSAISQAIAAETARTESTYLKEHQSLADYYTSAQTDNAIAGAIAAETARTENVYLKQGALNGYATENWVEGKGYLTSADTADFVTSAQTKTQIEGYHYTTSADTAQAISSALTGYYTSGQTDEKIQDAVSGIDLSDYYTSAQTDSKISSALTDYYTSGQTNSAISTATQNMVTSTAVNNIWVGTTAQYNAIATKDPNTLYFINNN